MKDDLAILIPCYNEGITIRKVVEDCLRDTKDIDGKVNVYVYDNNSTDNTVEEAKAGGAIVRYEYQQGKGNVIRRMFREINASLTHTDVLESKINELSEIEKDKIYRMVWAERVTEDILSHAEDIGVEISKEDAEILAESYACDGEYDCNLSYWNNIENLMEDYIKPEEDITE